MCRRSIVLPYALTKSCLQKLSLFKYIFIFLLAKPDPIFHPCPNSSYINHSTSADYRSSGCNFLTFQSTILLATTTKGVRTPLHDMVSSKYYPITALLSVFSLSFIPWCSGNHIDHSVASSWIISSQQFIYISPPKMLPVLSDVWKIR